ncbi:hypothetical protein FXO38_19383 [Capsicum annuum]|nr:hypothetical protein FXO38_19383 [Capsicum annuum]
MSNKKSSIEEVEVYVDAEPNIEEGDAQIDVNQDHQDVQLVDFPDDATWKIEDAEPLNSKYLEEGSDDETNAPIWVNQNIIRLSKEFGDVFRGSRKEALALFKKIDCRRKLNFKESETRVTETPKIKGLQELKGLAIDMKFQAMGRELGGKEILGC